MITFHHNSGFFKTTVTKGLLGTLVLSSVALTIPLHSYRFWFRLNYATLFEKFDLLKYVGYRSVFLDPKDIFCASILLYHFRIFERKYGSWKFANYILGTFVITCLLEIGCLYAFHQFGLSPIHLPTGPYGVVFPWFIPYYLDIPRVAASHVFGVFPITGKSINYIIGLQMAAGSLESLMLVFCSVMAGLIYRHNLFWCQKVLQFPSFLAKMLNKTIGQLIESKTEIGIELPMGATLEIQRQQRMEQLEQQLVWTQFQHQPHNGIPLFGRIFGNGNQANGIGRNADANQGPVPAVAAPSEESVHQLVEMGFTRDNVVQALQLSNNDISLATNLLLQNS